MVVFVINFVIMFNIWYSTGGYTCGTVADANAIIMDILNTHPDKTVCCELVDDDDESLSYWEFTSGDTLIPDGAQP